MTTTKSGTSRASSARPSSVARTIAKRRDKAYRTEKSRVLAKKRKLNIHTTYTAAPDGFQFLPVGTPGLADRCKELSRQRGLPVNVVNAKPVSKQAVDPEKVSHHIHRIGYHFRSDVVDDACQQLGYTYSHGKFIKEDELREQNDQGKLARAMAKHGLHLSEPLRQETDDQVRAAIKELFPRIPESDLKAILQHAWEEGSRRVGTNAELELPRRVQLATIARIRHTYTDYDRLLRAFEWKDARTLVEPVCLAKLIEWRGENDEEDDNELEEIVRETIVIDDDDDNDALRNGSEADDEDSMIEDGGYVSDTSVEISHRPAVDADLVAESNDERSRRFLNRYRPPPRSNQRYLDVRQKIGVVREQLRNGIALDHAQQPEVVRVHIPESGDGLISINGQLYRREAAQTNPPRTLSQPLVSQPARPILPVGSYGDERILSPQSRFTQPLLRPANFAGEQLLHDRPIASIEPHDELRRMAINSATLQHEQHTSAIRSRPITPESQHFGKRRRTEYPGPVVDSPGPYIQQQSPSASLRGRPIIPSSEAGKVVDLTLADSPPFYHGHRSSGTVEYPPAAIALHGRSEVPNGRVYSSARNYTPVEEAYDHNRLSLPAQHTKEDLRADARHREQDIRRGFVDAQVAPIQYVPLPQQNTSPMNSRPATGYQIPDQNMGFSRVQQQPQVVYVQSRQPSNTPQPVHGAPAAVQQIPREPLFPTPAPAQSAPASTAYGPTQQTPSAQAPPFQAFIPQPQYYYPR